MRGKTKALLIAAPRSGAGKTTVTLLTDVKRTEATAKLSAGDQRGFDAVFRSGQVIWSDDLPSDPRFATKRKCPTESIAILTGAVPAGVFPLTAAKVLSELTV